MPQLEQVNTFISQIFWLFVCLGVVYFFLSRFAIPRLSGVVEKRETVIASDINSAEQLKDLATITNKEVEKRSASDRADAFTLTADAAKRAAVLYDKNISKTDEELKKDIEASEKEINLQKQKALKELNDSIPAYVNQIVEKIASIKVEKSQVDKLLKTGS